MQTNYDFIFDRVKKKKEFNKKEILFRTYVINNCRK
jgi:alpha-mannosidase